MNKFKKYFLILAISLAVVPQASAEDASKVFEKASRSVVVVLAGDNDAEIKSQGSGVIIGKGEGFTNCHVIEEANYIGVATGKSEPKIATLFRADWEKDICLLKVPGIKGRKAKIRPSNSLKIGESVYAIGAPEGMEYSLSAGLVSQLRRKGKDEPPIIQTDASIASGSSGGGLFDKKGKLVGVISFRLKEAKNIGFAVPVEWIDETRREGIKTASTIESVKKPYAKSSLSNLQFAALLGENQDWTGLEKHSLQWTELLPSDSFAWFSLGNAYNKQGRYGEAIDSYREALRINPEDAETWINLGIAYGKQGRYNKAIGSFREALRINPEHAESWYNLGVIYGKQGRYDKAIDSYREALRINPEHAKAWYNLGIAYGKQGRYDKAIDSYREALRINPEDAEAWNNLGIAYTRQERYDKAIDSYHEALRINPEYAEAWNNLGNVYGQQGRYGKAIDSCREALRINPEYAGAWAVLSLSYKNNGQHSQAKKAYWRLRELDPDSARKIRDFIFR